jgi:hypothetical protein
MSISRECCVFSSRVLCEGPITRPEDSECGMCECDLKASTVRRPRTTSCPDMKINTLYYIEA